MKISNKLIIFGLILFVSLTAVSAADIIDDDSSAVAVETPQVEPDNTESIAPSVQETQQEDEVQNTDPGANPSTFTSLTDGATYENAIITLGSDASYIAINPIKNIKKDESQNTTIIIDESNINEYIDSQQTNSYIFGDKIKTTDNLIINLTNGTQYIIRFNVNSPRSLRVEGDHITEIIYPNTVTNATNIYAPNTLLTAVKIDVINCTIKTITNMRSPALIENNTIINLNSTGGSMQRCNWAATTGTIRNNYLFFYVPAEDKYYLGLEGANIGGSTATFENITPNYDNYQLLSNSNYSTFFDENNILKEEYADSTLIAVENITNPVIIDKKVTLSAVRGHTGYSNVKFIEGSDESIIEDSLINNLEINNAVLINVHNNKLIGDNAQIKLVETSNSIIENNIINTTKDYTIVLDENSMDNTIKNNELIATQYTGDKSVQNTAENTIEGNTPEYEEPAATPELKVDTTQFTIGEKTTIKAGIYLDDEIASNITGGKVVFKVNGKTLKDANGKVIYAKLINGVATIEDYEIPNSWNKEGLTITAVYSGSSKCEALRSQEANITTTTPTPQITTQPVTTTTGSTIQLKAKITAGDNPITNGKVVFKVNGKTVKDNNGKVIYATVDSNGEASVNYTIPESYKTGNYTITITYTSPNYGKLNTTSTLTITA